ncbi:hypothetical protein niasHT_017797 [Heterodera trifolii]|uniref:Homeobox domain-containing protein n=1 Tax=Heterodera trifolii TaxID=157864 RepID=A0ABD2L4S8_9BILA
MSCRKTKNSNLTSGGERKRRTRRTFTREQIGQMEMMFSCSHFPDMLQRDELALKTGLDEDRILIWFQNRRAKWRREMKSKEIKNGAKMEKMAQNEGKMEEETAILCFPLIVFK